MIVVWRVTERCNLQCPFCAYDRTVRRSRMEADPAAIRAFGSILAEYQRTTGDSVLVSWLGGEPLRWSALAELSHHFRHDLRLRVSTTTNGTTLGSAETKAQILRNYDELTVSVDGLGEVHDRLRGWPGGFAHLRREVRALSDARCEQQPLLRINVLLQRQTIAEFRALCHELADWGVDEITFNQLGGRDRPEYFPAHRLLPDQIERFRAELPELRAALSHKGIRLAGSDAYLDRFAASARDERLAFPECAPGERFLFIDETGRISPCSFTPDDICVSLTTITSAADLLRLPATFHHLRHTRRPAPCQDCHSTQVFTKFAA